MVKSFFFTTLTPMPNLIKISVLVFCFLISSFTQAEETIIDPSSLTGTWKLITAGPKLKVETKKSDTRLKETPYSYLAGSGNKAFNETWKFAADGSFELTAADHRASGTITSTSTYKIEDNLLKIAKIGRPGKYFTYTVKQSSFEHKEGDETFSVHLEDDEMIIRGGMEGYYTFKKQ